MKVTKDQKIDNISAAEMRLLRARHPNIRDLVIELKRKHGITASEARRYLMVKYLSSILEYSVKIVISGMDDDDNESQQVVE